MQRGRLGLFHTCLLIFMQAIVSWFPEVELWAGRMNIKIEPTTRMLP